MADGDFRVSTINKLAGRVDKSTSFHYDLGNDVLYLRRLDHRQSPAIGEDTPDDLILFRHEETGEPIGLTIVDWWRRFGGRALPDSIDELSRAVEPWARQIPAA